jgi:ABC-type multidrug transport system fused ATPase/permease subunit
MAKVRSTGVWGNFRELYGFVQPERRREIWLLVFLTLLGATSEVVAIGSVVPFLALLAGGSPQIRWIEPLFELLGAYSRQQQLAVAASLLCAAAVAAAVLRLTLVRLTQDFVFSFGHQLSVEVQRRMLLQPYLWHVGHNSSDQIATIEKVELVTSAVLLPLIQALASTVLVATIIAILVRIAPLPTIVASLALAASYLILGAVARRRLKMNSQRLDRGFEQRIRTLQEGIGGIRDTILDGSHASVLERFRNADLELATARADIVFISAVPRYVIEAAGIVVIAGLALILSSRSGGLVSALPVLGALALGAQRLLPLVQQLYQGWSDVVANQAIINDVARRLRLRIPPTMNPGPRLPFTRSVEFRDVGFSYNDRVHRAVSGLSFDIHPGSRIALTGPTGSGKSTTADLLMGLLEPSEGEIFVDGIPLSDENRQAWRANVAHVPQMLFLADASIAQNIALTSTVDRDRVRQAASLAQLDAFIESLPDAYETHVGERGARISGGQRQRLAIARAIYKDTPLLILDEATSALDDETEAAVLRALDYLREQGRTVLIISHRSTTIEGCDRTLRLENGRIA